MKLLALALVLLAAGCSAGTEPAAGRSPSTAPTASPTEQCPEATSGSFSWPAAFPRDLPQPPGARLQGQEERDGISLVRFSTPTSLRQGVVFLLREVPRAGYTLGRGDAEPAEADAPFGRGDLQGVYKLRADSPCRTTWLLAVTRSRAARPFLPTASPGPSSSALPFG